MTGERKPLTMTQRKHHYYMADALRRFEWDIHNHLFEVRQIPKEWHDIASERDSAKKQLTVRFDEDVIKWFKSMGPGYQPRMNAVLRAFMHMKLAGFLQGEETIEPFRDSHYAGAKRPYFGEFEEYMADLQERQRRLEQGKPGLD